jgi:hypothetical protein
MTTSIFNRIANNALSTMPTGLEELLARELLVAQVSGVEKDMVRAAQDLVKESVVRNILGLHRSILLFHALAEHAPTGDVECLLEDSRMLGSCKFTTEVWRSCKELKGSESLNDDLDISEHS